MQRKSSNVDFGPEIWIPTVEKPYDWLFADLSLSPSTSLQILEKYIQRRLMRKFVFTLKFIGYAVGSHKFYFFR